MPSRSRTLSWPVKFACRAAITLSAMYLVAWTALYFYPGLAFLP